MVGCGASRMPHGLVGLVAIIGLAASLVGCGGHGPPRSDSDLIVRSRAGGGWAPDAWSVEVEGSGWCRAFAQSAPAGEPVGFFEAQLDEPLIRKLRVAMGRARRAGLAAEYYSPPDAGVCVIEIPVADGFQTVEFSFSVPRLIPEALRPLYRRRDQGLLVDTLNAARQRPTSAVALVVPLDRETYRVGEAIASQSIIRSVGTASVSFPSTSVEELAAAYLLVDLMEGEGPDPDLVDREGRSLGPEARDDLLNVVVLAPGEEYRIPPVEGPVAPAAGPYQVNGTMNVRPRYAQEPIEEALGAPMPFMRSASVPITVVE